MLKIINNKEILKTLKIFINFFCLRNLRFITKLWQFFINIYKNIINNEHICLRKISHFINYLCDKTQK